ncbi:MAG: DUF2336 domain-containing protein [Alphaproteobacteria bacterium]
MDLSVLDKSPQMTPLLVKLYDSQKLHGLAKDKQPLARAELTSAVCQLLEMELSPRESELIADVMVQLMRQAEIDLRQALAEKLSTLDNVPLRLILQLANDDISVAGSILSKSMILSDLDLIYIIKAKGADYWQSIAKRPQMSDQIINILVDTGEEGTLGTLIKNKNIRLTDYAVDVCANKACENEALAKPLLQRPEITPDIAKRLYQHVGEALKQFINDNHDVEIGSVADLIDDVIEEFVGEEDSEDGLMPTQTMLKDAQRYKEKGLLTFKLMLGTLRRGQFPAFIAQFSKFTGMPAEIVRDVLIQDNGQGLAIACKAYGIAQSDFVSIFLLTNNIRESEKMVDMKGMSKAISYYTRIDEKVARDIIENSKES